MVEKNPDGDFEGMDSKQKNRMVMSMYRSFGLEGLSAFGTEDVKNLLNEMRVGYHHGQPNAVECREQMAELAEYVRSETPKPPDYDIDMEM